MRLHLLALLLIIALAGSQLSCKKTRPQLPSNKATDDEINRKEGLEKTNRSLILLEDSLLKEKAKKSLEKYERSELGFWYQLLKQETKKTLLKTEEECRVSYQILLFDSTVVEEQNKLSVRIGRKELINGIDFALEMLHKGDSVNLLIPWYLAYGSRGKTDLVPPYTSVFCRLKIEED